MPTQWTVSLTDLMSEDEADLLLQEHNITPPPALWITPYEDVDYGDSYKQNQEIIEACDTLIMKRISGWDPSVRISEVNATRAEAFKQNQLIKGGATENVSFNIKMIQEMSPDQLFDLLWKLND